MTVFLEKKLCKRDKRWLRRRNTLPELQNDEKSNSYEVQFTVLPSAPLIPLCLASKILQYFHSFSAWTSKKCPTSAVIIARWGLVRSVTARRRSVLRTNWNFTFRGVTTTCAYFSALTAWNISSLMTASRDTSFATEMCVRSGRWKFCYGLTKLSE